jgi:TPR repeat protein
VRAAAVLTRACGAPKEAGFMADMPPSCARLGRMYLDGEGVARDEQQALALFELACFSRSGIGCYELGRLHLRGMGVARDTAKAEELFDKACALESQSASFDKGGCLLVEKECEVDAPRNCMAAAMAIRDDEARSAALHRRACAAGKAEACNWAARKYEFGATTSTASARPAPIDLRLARSLYERGCELDAKGPACAGALRMDDAACRDAPSAAERAGACLRAGRRHETATGGLVSQSLYLAAKSYEAACGLEPGGPGCAELERLCAWAPGAQKWMEVQGACPRRRP